MFGRNSHGTKFEFKEKSGGFGRGQNGIDSVAVFLARWIAVSGANLGNGSASRTGTLAEGEVEGARRHRQCRGGERRRYSFSVCQAAGSGRRSAGDPRAFEWEATRDFRGGVRPYGHD